MRDGGRPLARSGGGRESRAEDGAYRAAKRARSRQRRDQADRSGRHCGSQHRGAGGGIGGVTHICLTASSSENASHRQRVPLCIPQTPRTPMPFLREKNGRWSLEKIIAFVGSCVPILWLSWRVWTNDLNPARPVNETIHSTGNYVIWLIVLSLAVSPARRLFGAPKLINMRRTLGVAAFCYAALHLTLYVVQEKYDLVKVASEIVFRIYLTIGFVALLGLIALAATSTDAMIRRLGPRWNTLHTVIYGIAILGIIHFMMQTKLDITEAVMVGGFLIWLLGYRLMHRFIG